MMGGEVKVRDQITWTSTAHIDSTRMPFGQLVVSQVDIMDINLDIECIQGNSMHQLQEDEKLT